MKKKSFTSAFMAFAFISGNTVFLAQASQKAPVELAQPNKTVNQENCTSKTLLMKRLAKLNFFTASFTQQVLSESGELLEESAGKLAIRKPNLANWQVLMPDELSIVSDGTNVWFYDPWIEQVSIYSLSTAIARTPMLLLTSEDESLWSQYNVEEKLSLTADNSKSAQQVFVISAIDINSQVKSLTLTFNTKDQGEQLSEFSFLDATGQKSRIKLTAFNDQQAPKADLFNFVIPPNTQIDDQR
jgi:outer membrane lipoprotein carrier protein